MHKVIDTDSLRKVLKAANLLDVKGTIEDNRTLIVTSIDEIDEELQKPKEYTVDEIIAGLEANTQGEMYLIMEKRLNELEAENALIKDQLLDFYIYKLLFEEMIESGEIDNE